MKEIIVQKVMPGQLIQPDVLAAQYDLLAHDEDRREMDLLGVGIVPYVRQTILGSRCAYAVFSPYGELLNMMGVSASEDEKMGVPVWSLKCRGQKEYPREFVHYGRRAIRHFLQVAPKLYNFISTENRGSLRFIESCGAEFLPDIRYGAKGYFFRPFILTKEAFERCVGIR